MGIQVKKDKALKSTYGWTTNGDDIFGFNALPGGYRFGSGSFGFRNVFFDVWSVEGWKQFSDNDNIGGGSAHQDHGFAVRCVKSSSPGSFNDSFLFSWSPTNETTSSITVQPNTTSTYTVDVTSGTTTCQSNVTISVNQRDFVTIDSTACDSIQWDGNWLASTSSYVDTLQNLAGCDSIVTLNLTINQSTTGTDVLTACDTLTWIDGITYSASNNTATYTLTNAAGCDSIVTLNLTINSSPTVDLGNDTNLCDNASIDLFAGSGFTYLWQDGSTDSSLTASITGTYDVTITDANGCIASDSININVLSPLSVIKDSTAVTCNGLNDGSASATVSGGLAPYSYLWLDNGQTYTTPNATDLPAGTYSFVVTDSNGCSLTDSVTITEPTQLTASVQAPPAIADFSYVGDYNNQHVYLPFWTT